MKRGKVIVDCNTGIYDSCKRFNSYVDEKRFRYMFLKHVFKGYESIINSKQGVI